MGHDKKTHDKCVFLEYEKLKAEGYRCVPLVAPLPDVIAVKGDNLQIVAVEVAHKIAFHERSRKERSLKKLPYYDDVKVVTYPKQGEDASVENIGWQRPWVTLDDKGRFLVPKHLLKQLGLGKGAVATIQIQGKNKILLDVVNKRNEEPFPTTRR